MNRIRVGLAGYGFSGRFFHAPFLCADERFVLKKVLQREGSLAAEEHPGTEVVRTYEELLADDIDLVVLSLPHKLHFSYAEQAILAGKNVVVEKPFTPTAEEAIKLEQLAREKGVLLSIYQNRRFDGDFLTVQKLVNSGVFGKIVDFECNWERFAKGGSPKPWKNEQIAGNGAFYNLGVHLVDQVYTLFGMPKEIYAEFRKQRDVNVFPDNFRLYCYYEGMTAVIRASEMAAMPAPRFVVQGTDAGFTKRGFDCQEASLCSGKCVTDPDWGMEPEANYGLLLHTVTGATETIPTEAGNYAMFYDNIYKALCEGGELYVKPAQVVEVMRLMDAALLSNEQGNRIKL